MGGEVQKSASQEQTHAMDSHHDEVILIVEQSLAAKNDQEFHCEADVGQPAPKHYHVVSLLVLVRILGKRLWDSHVNVLVLHFGDHWRADYLKHQKDKLGRLQSWSNFSL